MPYKYINHNTCLFQDFFFFVRKIGCFIQMPNYFIGWFILQFVLSITKSLLPNLQIIWNTHFIATYLVHHLFTSCSFCLFNFILSISVSQMRFSSNKDIYILDLRRCIIWNLFYYAPVCAISQFLFIFSAHSSDVALALLQNSRQTPK